VYRKIVTGKVQVAYFENVFSDWLIFKEAVLLSNQRFPNNSFAFLSRHFVCFEFYSSSSVSHRWIRGSLKYYLGEPLFFLLFFCDDYYSGEKISLTSDLLI
jgi:hypothetical protein